MATQKDIQKYVDKGCLYCLMKYVLMKKYYPATHIYIYVYVYTSVSIYIYIYIYMCVRVSIYVFIYIYMHLSDRIKGFQKRLINMVNFLFWKWGLFVCMCD